MFGNPQGVKCFARSAGHDQFAAFRCFKIFMRFFQALLFDAGNNVFFGVRDASP